MDRLSATYWRNVTSLQKAKTWNKLKVYLTEDAEIPDGHRVLGSVIGPETACDKFRNYYQSEYNQIVEKLSKHAKIFAQNVFHQKSPKQSNFYLTHDS